MTARTIVITGASDGIGASAARTLSKQGERVVVVGRSAEKTKRIADEIGADYFVSDFAELAQVRHLAAQLKEKICGCQPLRVGPSALAGHYSDYASTMSWSDCHAAIPPPCLLSACWRLPEGATWLSQVPMQTVG